jgi:hypothetical protein
MTRWSAITRTRGRRSALAYGSRSTTAAEHNLNRLIHHERGRYWSDADDVAKLYIAIAWLLGGAEQGFRRLARLAPSPRQHVDG